MMFDVKKTVLHFTIYCLTNYGCYWHSVCLYIILSLYVIENALLTSFTKQTYYLRMYNLDIYMYIKSKTYVGFHSILAIQNLT